MVASCCYNHSTCLWGSRPAQGTPTAFPDLALLGRGQGAARLWASDSLERGQTQGYYFPGSEWGSRH